MVCPRRQPHRTVPARLVGVCAFALLLTVASCSSVLGSELRYVTPDGHKVVMKLPCRPEVERSSNGGPKTLEVRVCNSRQDGVNLVIFEGWVFASPEAAYSDFIGDEISLSSMPKKPEIVDRLVRGVPVKDIVVVGKHESARLRLDDALIYSRKRMLWFENKMYILRYNTTIEELFTNSKVQEIVESLEPKSQ